MSKLENRKIFLLCPSCAYFLLDKWLGFMSSRGWHLVDYKRVIFVFQRGNPIHHQYFTYKNSAGFRRDDGYYSIPLRYPLLDHQYGEPKRKSKLNAKKKITSVKRIIRIDKNKIDAGYYELIRMRDHLYLQRWLRDCLIWAAIIAFFIIK